MLKNHYILYGTANCHLCEDAIGLIKLSEFGIDLAVIDIAENEALYARYALSIPVLKCQKTEHELNWPFNLAMLKVFFDTNR